MFQLNVHETSFDVVFPSYLFTPFSLVVLCYFIFLSRFHPIYICMIIENMSYGHIMHEKQENKIAFLHQRCRHILYVYSAEDVILIKIKQMNCMFDSFVISFLSTSSLKSRKRNTRLAKGK